MFVYLSLSISLRPPELSDHPMKVIWSDLIRSVDLIWYDLIQIWSDLGIRASPEEREANMSSGSSNKSSAPRGTWQFPLKGAGVFISRCLFVFICFLAWSLFGLTLKLVWSLDGKWSDLIWSDLAIWSDLIWRFLLLLLLLFFIVFFNTSILYLLCFAFGVFFHSVLTAFSFFLFFVCLFVFCYIYIYI